MQRPLLVLKPALFFTYLLFDRRLGLAETKTRQTFVWIIAENELRMCTRSEACADSYLPRDRQHRSAIPTMRDAGNEPAQVFFSFCACGTCYTSSVRVELNFSGVFYLITWIT